MNNDKQRVIHGVEKNNGNSCRSHRKEIVVWKQNKWCRTATARRRRRFAAHR